MRNKLVAGNWKMNTSLHEALELAGALAEGITGAESAQIIVCPPFPWLVSVKAVLGQTGISVGAQNCSDQEKGAFTGEVAANMLRSAGCDYVILGHSERRSIYNEQDAVIAAKVNVAISKGLTAILCVGETLEERNSGQLEDVIRRQLSQGVSAIQTSDWNKLVIAYEPVWAIGTGKTASTAQAQEIHAFIRGLIAQKYSDAIAQEITIQYGGSVKPENAAELFAAADIDGALVGGAALQSRSFVDIIKAMA
jgi:triosephosphate isomerase